MLSGGGTRAAALSYGIMEALRDTVIRSERPFSRVIPNGLMPCHSERSEESAVGNTAGDGARFEEIPRRYAPRNDRRGARNDRGVASAFLRPDLP